MPIKTKRTTKTSTSPIASSLQKPDGGRWPRQLSTAEEAKILDAAFDVFIDKGLNGATTDLIAKKAGISKPTLYRRYKNKLDIFEHVVYQSREAVRGAFDDIDLDENEVETSLRSYAMRIREINSSPRYIETNRLMLSEARRHPELVQVWRQSLLEEILARLVTYFELLTEKGAMKHDYPQLAARNFLVTFAGSFKPLYGVIESEEERARVFESDLATFIRGCQIDTRS